jgi:hypothetical protein
MEESDRRTQVFVFSNLHGLSRYFGRVLPRDIIQEEVIIATRDFRPRAHANANQTQLEFVKLCEARLVRKAKVLKVEV